MTTNGSEFDDRTVIQGGAGGLQEVPKAQLVCLDDMLDESLKGLEIALADKEQTIGRGPSNTVRLHYKKISRQHARFFPNNGVWEIEDLNSANGVFVNEVRVSRTRLGHGDIVRLGPVPFRYELERPALNPAVNPPASGHVGEKGTMYAFHAGVLESLAVKEEEPAKVRDGALPAPKQKRNKVVANTRGVSRSIIRYTLILLVGAVLGMGYLYLNHQRQQEVDALVKEYNATFLKFIENYEEERGPFPLRAQERELGEIRTMAAHVDLAAKRYPKNFALTALQARLLFLEFERKLTTLLSEGRVYDAGELVAETRTAVSSLPHGKGADGRDAIPEVLDLLDLAQVIVRFKQFKKRFPNPSISGPFRPDRYELREMQDVKKLLIEKKKAAHLLLSVTYIRFQHLLSSVEEQDVRLINRWQEVLKRE